MKKISDLQIGIMNYFLMRAFFIGITFTSLIKITKQDSWIIPLLEIPIGILFIVIINTIINFKPNIDFPNKIKKLFNKNISAFLIITICLIAIFLCIFNYNNLNNFIHNQFLNKTPITIISIIFIISTIYVLNKGINTIFKLCTLLFYISMVLFLLSFIGLIPIIQISNLKPIFQFNGKNILDGLILFYSFNITPILLIAIIPKDKIIKCNIKKALIISSIFSIITLFFVTLFTLSSFGYEISALYEYPEFAVLKNISLFGLTSRIESILVVQWLFDMYIYNLFVIYFIYKCISCLFKNIEYKKFNYIFCSILVIIIFFISKLNIYLENFVLNYTNIPLSIITITYFTIIYFKIKRKKV